MSGGVCSIFCGALKDGFAAQGMEVGPQCCASELGGSVIAMALFIIGCMGAAGAFPGGATIGWVTLGLGAGMLALKLVGGNWEKRKFELISWAVISAALITVGALGGTGILTTAQVGYGIIGTTLIGGVGMVIYKKCIAPPVNLEPEDDGLLETLY